MTKLHNINVANVGVNQFLMVYTRHEENDDNTISFFLVGMHNVLSLFCALVTENKVLLFSSSYSSLTSASLGLLAILYPLKFRYSKLFLCKQIGRSKCIFTFHGQKSRTYVIYIASILV